MKIIETIKRHANIALALGVMLSMIAAQAIPVFASPSVSAAGECRFPERRAADCTQSSKTVDKYISSCCRYVKRFLKKRR